jgi:hypothetical protein
MLAMLPAFGGALGGVIAAGLREASAPSGYSRGAAALPRASGGSSPLRWIFGLLLLLGGGFFLLAAVVQFCNTWEIARRKPKVVTAAEFSRNDYPGAAPAWISYTFSESKPIDLNVSRPRLDGSGDVQARCLLVKVEDKWLVATVAPGFKGKSLVGRLHPVDSPASRPLIEQIRQQQRQPSALLPYEFNAVEGSASDQRERYTLAAGAGCIGLVGVLPGLYLLCRKRRSA